MQQLRFSFAKPLLYMFRVTIPTIIRSTMLYMSNGEISRTRCNNCVVIPRNGFTLHFSDDNLTHLPEYICCIWPMLK